MQARTHARTQPKQNSSPLLLGNYPKTALKWRCRSLICVLTKIKLCPLFCIFLWKLILSICGSHVDLILHDKHEEDKDRRWVPDPLFHCPHDQISGYNIDTRTRAHHTHTHTHTHTHNNKTLHTQLLKMAESLPLSFVIGMNSRSSSFKFYSFFSPFGALKIK
jgi:hypothetical protein